jgi:hypothetical protein
MSFALLGRIGVSSSSMAATRVQLAKWGSAAGGTAAEGFIAGFAGQAGGLAFTAIFNKLFGGKGGPTEQATGITGPVAGLADFASPGGMAFKMKAALAASGAGLIALAAAGARSAMQVKDFSEQTGLSISEVQELDKAARKSGLSFEFVATKLDQLGQARKAAGSDLDTRESLQALGLSTEEILGPQSNLELLRKLNPEASRSDFRKAFGRGGEKMTAVLRNLREGVPGLDISTENVMNIDMAGKKVESLGRSIKNAGANMLGAGVGKLREILESPDSILNRPGYVKNFKEGLLGLISFIGKPIGKKLGMFPEPGDTGPGYNEAVTQTQNDLDQEHGAQQIIKDEIAAKERLELDKETIKAKEAAHKLKFEQMTASEKEADLRDRIGLQQDIARTTASPFHRQEALAEADQLQLQLMQMLRGQMTPMDFDPLAKIGGHTGSTGDNSMNYLERIASASEATASNTGGTGSGIP